MINYPRWNNYFWYRYVVINLFEKEIITPDFLRMLRFGADNINTIFCNPNATELSPKSVKIESSKSDRVEASKSTELEPRKVQNWSLESV